VRPTPLVPVLVLLASAGCASTSRPHPPTPQPALADGSVADATAAAADTRVASGALAGRRVLAVQTGSASYYSDALAGRPTASGEPYDPRQLVAAHREYPFGTILRVTSLASGRSVEVRVVDRGPFAYGRVLDLSRRAAEELDMIEAGHVEVRIEVLWFGG
jgi:rare lipoprotein A